MSLIPKVLPHCSITLFGHVNTDIYVIVVVIKSCVCREKTDVKIEDMPSAIADLKTFCDACIKQGKMKMTAKCFCIQCKKKFCAKHVEVSPVIFGKF